MKLTRHEQINPLWMKLEAHFKDRLNSLRCMNDGEKNEVETANMRGRIAEVKAMLALAEELP